MLTELYDKLAYLAQTQAINSDSHYVRELWKKSVRTTMEEFAVLREIENMVTPKAFELMKSQASLFPKYHVSPYDMVKDRYDVMHDSKKGANSSAVNAMDDHESVNITYLTKAKKDEIACLDEGFLEFTTVSFVEASLKTSTCQYSRNYGLLCRHQFAVAYFCGLKAVTIDFVHEFWWKVDDAENNLSSNNKNLYDDSMKGTTIALSNNDRFEFLKKMCLPACEVASQKMSLFYSLSTTIDNWTKFTVWVPTIQTPTKTSLLILIYQTPLVTRKENVHYLDQQVPNPKRNRTVDDLARLINSVVEQLHPLSSSFFNS